MDIRSDFLENSCVSFVNKFNSVFDFIDSDVAFIRIDLENKKINTVNSNYDWLLMNWADDLDLIMSERISSDIQFWNNYSSAYGNTFSKIKNNKMKVDICHRSGNVYELISINTKKDLSSQDILNLYRFRPMVSDFSYHLWRQKDNIDLPLREVITLPSQKEGELNYLEADLSDIHKYMRFGDIRLTQKEMLTIRMLLSQCQIKEISHIQECSIASENKRIQNIKEKLGCPHASSSGLFKALNEHGITAACLDLFFTKQ